MPLTDALKNAEEFCRVGFTDEQAGLLAHKLEEAIQANNQDLKTFIREQFEAFAQRMEVRFGVVDSRFDSIDSRFGAMEARMGELRSDLRTEMHSLARDQLLKFITVLVAVVSLAVAVIKIFPNVH